MMLALAGDSALTPPTLLTCGYTLDGDKIGRIVVRRDCIGHPPWHYEIYGGRTAVENIPFGAWPIRRRALPGQRMRRGGAVAATSLGVAGQLTADRRRRSPQAPSDHTHPLAGGPAQRDLAL